MLGIKGNKYAVLSALLQKVIEVGTIFFSGSWGYYNWNGLDLTANIKSIK